MSANAQPVRTERESPLGRRASTGRVVTRNKISRVHEDNVRWLQTTAGRLCHPRRGSALCPPASPPRSGTERARPCVPGGCEGSVLPPGGLDPTSFLQRTPRPPRVLTARMGLPCFSPCPGTLPRARSLAPDWETPGGEPEPSPCPIPRAFGKVTADPQSREKQRPAGGLLLFSTNGGGGGYPDEYTHIQTETRCVAC